MSKKVRLMDLIQAPELQVREVNPVVVGNYSESIKAGAVFPPIIIDEKNRIICGNHRFSAYKKNYEPDALIECEVVKGKSDVDLIMIAAGDNSKNGWPLTTFEKKSISLRLINRRYRKFQLKVRLSKSFNVKLRRPVLVRRRRLLME